MKSDLSLSQLWKRFPTHEACLEEIKKLRYPNGIKCLWCDSVTNHYKLQNRMAYACSLCRRQTYPLKGTIFEKTSTPLRLWFFSMYLLTQTYGTISARDLQKELGVTYKTAWRIKRQLLLLMKQHNADLLTGPERILALNFFNAFELKFVEKKQEEEL